MKSYTQYALLASIALSSLSVAAEEFRFGAENLPLEPQAVIVQEQAPIAALNEVLVEGGIEPRPDSFFAPLVSVDLRDVGNSDYNKIELVGAANLLMRVMEANPARFVGTANGLQIDPNSPTTVRFLPSGAVGPKGHAEKVTDDNGGTKTVFVIDDDNTDTIRNSILGAEIEGVREVRREPDPVGAKIVDLQLLLFVRDDSRTTSVIKADGAVSTLPYYLYFRRVRLRIDWTKPKPDENRVIVYGLSEPDIPLSNTNFEVFTGLLDRKVVLMERKHRIYKVFPVGVGSFDIRTNFGMDFLRYGGAAKAAKKAIPVETMTGEFPNAILTKASVWQTGPWGTNSRSRTWPEYFSGRPFFGIRDITSGEPIYKQVGMHYRITTPLLRAFVSHGCIRVRDQDLYQLDAIVNDGPNDKVPIKVLNNLDAFFAQFNPLMPAEEGWYNAVVYSQLPSQNSVSCKAMNLDQSFTVKWAGTCNVQPNKNGSCPGRPEGQPNAQATFNETSHTVSDSECLTKIENVKKSPAEVVSYMRGQSGVAPQTLAINLEHYPVMIENGQDPDAGEPEENATFTAESGRKRRGNLIDAIFGEGGFFGPNVEPGFDNERPAQLEVEDRIGLKARLDQSRACMVQNDQYRQQNGCPKRKIGGLEIFMSQHDKNCNVAFAQQLSCQQEAQQIKGQLGIE